MAHGGKRKGAGRKAGSRNKVDAELKAIIELEIPREERIRLLAERARGLTLQEVGRDGATRTFKKEPCFKSLELLEAYASGKPAILIEGNKDNPLHISEVQNIIGLKPQDFLEVVAQVKKELGKS